MEEVKVPEGKPIRLLEWLVKVDDWVKYGKSIVIYRHIEDPSTGIKTKELHLKSKHVGHVKKLCVEVGQVATPGRVLIELESCQHPVVMKDMCAECGQDLRLLEERRADDCARVSMVPNIPELKISSQQAEELGKQDQDRLHKLRKLVLLVDLDQTLIHTTQSQACAAMCKNDKNFYTYHLSKNEPTLYTKMRPHCRKFLDTISKKFELQIVTFGSRQYAHKIAEFLDPEGTFFAHRILSRDECINPMRKSGNLRHLFPCGDSMVCIIDDRDDVWNSAPNLILVKKYSYFPGTGDINSPEKLEQKKSTNVENINKNSSDSSKNSPRKRKTNSSPVEETSRKVRKSEENIKPDVLDDQADNLSKSDTESSTTAKSAEASTTTKTEENSQETTKNDHFQHSLPLNSASDSGDTSNSSKTNSTTPSTDDSNKDKNKSELDSVTTDESINSKVEQEQSSTINNTTTSLDNCVNIKATDNSSTQENSTENAENEKQTSLEPFPDNDDYLLYLQHTLTEIHSTYYEAYDKFIKGDFEHSPDLRGVLPFIRSKVLFDCYLVFTGVIPNHYKTNPEKHKAHVVARQLGATIDQNISKRTTHLIGGKKGTVKYQEAQKLGTVQFVSVDWLYTCSDRWERVSESLFPIPKARNPNNGCSSREGTPPLTKAVNWKTESAPKTYNPVTGKLISKMRESHLGDPSRQRQRKQLPVSLYSSLEDPKAVVALKVEVANEPSTSAGLVRTRKPSMAEVMGIGYSLSSNDISEMDREVDDLLSSDDDENNLGSLIDNVPSSSDASLQSAINVEEETKEGENKSEHGNSSSSSEEEFDHMAELLDHEMHYDENSDLDGLD